jgi:hypothetical protein
MEYLPREIAGAVRERLRPNKVVMVLGARRVGKTVLARQVLGQLGEPYLALNGDDIRVHDRLATRSAENFRQLLGDHRVLFIDEAQQIPDIGLKLKLMVDEIAGLRVLVSGSSSFDVHRQVGEPLTGRKHSFTLYPLSEREVASDPLAAPDRLRERLVFGGYPELTRLPNHADKADYLNEMVSAYLLKDILAYEDIRNSQKIFNLLRLVAFQVGGEVSLQELGGQLGISKNTVEKYLDLLQKVHILYRAGGFSRNLRKEVTKSARWYFIDNGVRNAVAANFSPVAARADMGQLWENYLVGERLKWQGYQRLAANNYFWRTYDQQEVDWVEEHGGQLHGHEFKWGGARPAPPPQWRQAYPEAGFTVITPDNYRAWLGL